ncbi:hypothetical protein GGR56DRAFT_674308 [Xylariaceae sp. FL0804]|nr:hypothetical protein GGR56DRAFT_674308 [Xylariaceae sp. FL0804]
MPVTSTLFRAARPAFQSSRPVFGRRAANNFSQRAGKSGPGRRWQSTAAGDDAAAKQQQQSWFKRMWDSPIGLKTVHFWAPVMKWALVLAGIGDFARPAENLSLMQNAALTATGLIWTRWCLIIKPKNYLLAAVNFFLGGVGIVQLTRIFSHRASVAGGAGAEARAEVAKAEAKGRQLEADVKQAVKS